jgi:hypothetical protein
MDAVPPPTFRPISAPLLGWSVLLAALLVLPQSLVAAGPGRIAVQTVPAGATVLLDGQPSGKSPVAIEGLSAGRYFVRVELDGFRPADVVVDLSSGQKYQSPPIELISVNAPPPKVEPAAPPIAPRPVATPAPVPAATPRPIEAVVAPPPAPVPTPPAPVTPPAPEPAATISPATADPVETTIRERVQTHLQTLVDGDVASYLEICAPTVDLYEEGAKNHAAIRKSREQLRGRWPSYEISNVRDLKILPPDRAGMRRASVAYDWNVSNPKTGKKASGSANDQLDFREVGGKWLLVRLRQNVERTRR